MGRPTKLTPDLSESIFSRMAEGESLRSICRDDNMPALGTIFRWVASNDQFREQYELAMAQRADALFEEMFDIADENSKDTYVDENGNERTNSEVVARSRLRVDTRKWALSKMLPKKYGDKLALGGADDLPPMQSITRIELVPLLGNDDSQD